MFFGAILAVTSGLTGMITPPLACASTRSAPGSISRRRDAPESADPGLDAEPRCHEQVKASR